MAVRLEPWCEGQLMGYVCKQRARPISLGVWANSGLGGDFFVDESVRLMCFGWTVWVRCHTFIA